MLRMHETCMVDCVYYTNVIYIHKERHRKRTGINALSKNVTMRLCACINTRLCNKRVVYACGIHRTKDIEGTIDYFDHIISYYFKCSTCIPNWHHRYAISLFHYAYNIIYLNNHKQLYYFTNISSKRHIFFIKML